MKNAIRLGLDIDKTITASPEFFSILSNAVRAAGGKVYIVSSRADILEARVETAKELRGLGIVYDELFHITADRETIEKDCQYMDLDWYQKYILQKINFCKYHKVDVYFDDEEKVIELFGMYAPEIQVFKSCQNALCDEAD